jgi:hypothetical protein
LERLPRGAVPVRGALSLFWPPVAGLGLGAFLLLCSGNQIKPAPPPPREAAARHPSNQPKKTQTKPNQTNSKPPVRLVRPSNSEPTETKQNPNHAKPSHPPSNPPKKTQTKPNQTKPILNPQRGRCPPPRRRGAAGDAGGAAGGQRPSGWGVGGRGVGVVVLGAGGWGGMWGGGGAGALFKGCRPGTPQTRLLPAAPHPRPFRSPQPPPKPDPAPPNPNPGNRRPPPATTAPHTPLAGSLDAYEAALRAHPARAAQGPDGGGEGGGEGGGVLPARLLNNAAVLRYRWGGGSEGAFGWVFWGGGLEGVFRGRLGEWREEVSGGGGVASAKPYSARPESNPHQRANPTPSAPAQRAAAQTYPNLT